MSGKACLPDGRHIFDADTGPCRCGAERVVVDTVPKNISAGEQRSLEKVALYRGFVGRMRAAMRNAKDQLRPDEPAYKILAGALGEKAP